MLKKKKNTKKWPCKGKCPLMLEVPKGRLERPTPEGFLGS